MPSIKNRRFSETKGITINQNLNYVRIISDVINLLIENKTSIRQLNQKSTDTRKTLNYSSNMRSDTLNQTAAANDHNDRLIKRPIKSESRNGIPNTSKPQLKRLSNHQQLKRVSYQPPHIKTDPNQNTKSRSSIRKPLTSNKLSKSKDNNKTGQNDHNDYSDNNEDFQFSASNIKLSFSKNYETTNTQKQPIRVSKSICHSHRETKQCDGSVQKDNMKQAGEVRDQSREKSTLSNTKQKEQILGFQKTQVINDTLQEFKVLSTKKKSIQCTKESLDNSLLHSKEKMLKNNLSTPKIGLIGQAQIVKQNKPRENKMQKFLNTSHLTQSQSGHNTTRNLSTANVSKRSLNEGTLEKKFKRQALQQFLKLEIPYDDKSNDNITSNNTRGCGEVPGNQFDISINDCSSILEENHHTNFNGLSQSTLNDVQARIMRILKVYQDKITNMNETVEDLKNENKILKRKLFHSVDITAKQRCQCECSNVNTDLKGK